MPSSDLPTADQPHPEKPDLPPTLPLGGRGGGGAAPGAGAGAGGGAGNFDDLEPDELIGPYRILNKLGEGGFGVVYLAQQDVPVQRRVALKIIKLGMDTRQVVARFEQERQALAMMDHPNIARVFDAGATASGRPYFVMEYVAGEPITRYCDRHRLVTRQRLELFLPVCEAVQHAHSKGIIHRDIKPSNVLVSVRDSSAEPKVIDFGVAKALSNRLVEKTIFTEHGQIIGTPEYMSPEQAEMGVLDIDTRSDVYSLGVLLYELLTGLLPFDPHDLRSAGYAEIQRIIREVEPPRPSTRLSSAGDDAVEIARNRHLHVDALTRDLRRELEWIPLMAMRKDRTQRYRTPIDLADDIRRYLDGRPIMAGPQSGWYYARKFVKRNRALVTAATLTLLAIVGGGVASGYFAWRESKAHVAEAQQRSVAESVNRFFIDDMLSSPDPEADGPEVKVLTILDRAASTMQSRFAAQPAVEARLQRTLGQAYLHIGRPEQAQPHFERAKALLPYLTADDPDAGARLDLALAEIMWRQDRMEQAIPALESLVQRLKSSKGADDALTLEAMNELGGAYKAAGKFDEAQATYTDAAARREMALGASNLDTLITRYNLVLVDVLRSDKATAGGDSAGGKATLERALAAMQGVQRDTVKALTQSHWQSIVVSSEVAAILNRLDRFDEANAAYEALLPAMRKTLGDEHWRTLQTIANFGILCFNHQQFERTATLLEEALPGYRRVRGAAYPDTIAVSNYLANAYESLSRFDAAGDLRIRTYHDMVAGNRDQPALQRQAARIRDFYQRRGDESSAKDWATRAGASGK